MALFKVLISTALVLVARAQYDDDSSYPKQPTYQPPYQPTYQPNPRPYSPPDDYQRPSPYVPQPVYPNPPNPSAYPNNPVYPQQPVYPNPPTQPPYPSNPVYPQKPVYPNPQTTSAYPSNPVYPQKPDYPNKPDTPYQGGDSSSSDDYSNFPYSVRPAPGSYPCKRNSDGIRYAVPYVCFAYFECSYGEALYRQCDKHFRFDEKSGRCVSDQSCVSACPDHIKPHPTDSYKFYLSEKRVSCPNRTYFNYRICTCQSPDNESIQYPPYRK